MQGKSGFTENQNTKDLLHFSAHGLGQSCPQDCPRREGHGSSPLGEQLGEPLNIREVARLIGCSVWTVRHRLLQRGLPYFRLAGNGRLIFYRNQVTQWVLETQNEGGDEK